MIKRLAMNQQRMPRGQQRKCIEMGLIIYSIIVGKERALRLFDWRFMKLSTSERLQIIKRFNHNQRKG